MNVKVEVELIETPTYMDESEMRASAVLLTNNKNSVNAYISVVKVNTVVAEFTIDKARQADVVERIGRQFRCHISKHNQSSISFPDALSKPIPRVRKRYTHKQGQYLVFIYYFTKLNRRAPAEADMQWYFRTTPPSVHAMVLKLEQLGLIERTPYQARSIRLLLSRDELPDLE